MTFHAACARILRREADRLGYRSNFTIYDQADQVRVVKACLEELERDPKRFPPRGIHSRISAEKNRLVSAAAVPREHRNFFDQIVADVFELYERRLHASNAMDFDDLLVRSVELLESFDDVRERWQGAFNHLLVDEYQDTNHAQYRIVRLLSGAHRNVFVVGDSDQSIYTWRGADIRNILDFERDFPDARVDPARAELPLDAAHPRRRERRHRAQRRAHREAALVRARHGRAGARDRGRGRARRGAHRRGADRRPLIEGGSSASRHRRLLPHERAVARARGPARAPRRALPGDRRPALLRARRDQGRDGLPAACSTTRPTTISLRRIINQPRRGIGDAERRSPRRHRRASAAARSGTRSSDPEGAGLGDRRRALGARVPRR